MHKFISGARAAVLIAAALTTAPAFAAHTGSGPGSIVNCDASGNRQATGAVIGGIAGAVVGNNVSHGKNAPVVGALAGAAAGSYVGCQQQRAAARRHATGQFETTSGVTVRAGASSNARRVDHLSAGERVQVTGYSGNWAHVRYQDNHTGFVSASNLRATGN